MTGAAEALRSCTVKVFGVEANFQLLLDREDAAQKCADVIHTSDRVACEPISQSMEFLLTLEMSGVREKLKGQKGDQRP